MFYTLCYMQCGFQPKMLIRRTEPFYFIFVGGNLKFDLGPHSKKRYHTCTEIRPRGSIIVFPSHLYHQVTPVTTGTRYSLVAWNLGKPFQ